MFLNIYIDFEQNPDRNMDVKNIKTEDSPLDLSVRRDSIDTRKTPSPYSSSGLSESSLTTPSEPRTEEPHSSLYNLYPFDVPRLSSRMSPQEYNHHVFGLYNTNDINDASSESSNVNADTHNIPMIMGTDGKLTRPFKAFPSNGLYPLDCHTNPEFQEYRLHALEEIRANNGGQMIITNPRMRRTSSSTLHLSNAELSNSDLNNPSSNMENEDTSAANDSSMKRDSAYYERRKKNNAAAKKSRDRRRLKEDEVSIRAVFFERQCIGLKLRLEAAYAIIAKLESKLGVKESNSFQELK